MKKNFLIGFHAVLVLMALFLGSCGIVGVDINDANYQYHPLGLRSSVGYSHTSLSKNVFRVCFSGTIGTSREIVYDLGVLRCSELVKEKGYNCFVILDSAIHTSNKPTTTTTTRYTGTISGAGIRNTYDHSAVVPSVVTGTETTVKTWHEAVFVIEAFKSKDEAHGKHDKSLEFEADFVMKDVREKYNMLDTKQCEAENPHGIEQIKSA